MDSSTPQEPLLKEPPYDKEEHQKKHFPRVGSWQDMLPEWAYDAGVADIAVRLVNDGGIFEPLPLQCAVGPAVRYALYASFATWGLFALVPWPVIATSSCDPNDGAMYNLFGVWGIVLPILLGFIGLEFLCLKYAIVPQLQTTGGFNFLIFDISFHKWFVYNLFVSLATHTDLVNNGIFLALAIRSQYCDTFGARINCIWGQTMAESIFSYIPGVIDHIQIPFHNLVLILWLVMPLQFVFGCMGYVPLPVMRKWIFGVERRIDQEDNQSLTYADMVEKYRGRYEDEEINVYWFDQKLDDEQGNGFCSCCISPFRWAAKKWEWAQYMLGSNWLPNYEEPSFELAFDFAWGGGGKGTRYQTFLDVGNRSSSDHGSALLSLADSTRMSSIAAMRLEYHRKKVRYYLGEQPQNNGPAFGLMKRMLLATSHKLVLFGIIQSGVQLNLQVTLLAMTTVVGKRLKHGEDSIGFMAGFTFVNHQLFFSIVIGLLNYWKSFYECICTDRWIARTLKEAGWKDIDTQPQKDFYEYVKKRLFRLRCAMVIYAWIGFYTILKFRAVFYCQDCMFNITWCAKISSCCFEDNPSETCGIDAVKRHSVYPFITFLVAGALTLDALRFQFVYNRVTTVLGRLWSRHIEGVEEEPPP